RRAEGQPAKEPDAAHVPLTETLLPFHRAPDGLAAPLNLKGDMYAVARCKDVRAPRTIRTGGFCQCLPAGVAAAFIKGALCQKMRLGLAAGIARVLYVMRKELRS